MKTDNSYQIFLESCLALAETIVIKSTAAAEALNQYLVDNYGSAAVDTLYPSTWKYYLNLAGEYHPTDTVMTVVSMDNLEKIIFSKENLLEHRATARGYAYGTRQYKELVAQYPEQELLIRGILYPVDIDKAITADDGAILGYPSYLVEENEYNLIAKLQVWLDGFRARHVNEQYSVSDKLYTASWMGMMYMQLPLAILTTRLEACHTNEAHSYHVRQYLASHGHLDAYMDQMTTKQALWLYRNIKYIRNHTGKQENFEWLIEHIMTERRLPLAEFTMRHDVSIMEPKVPVTISAFGALAVAGAIAQEEQVLYPKVTFVKKPVNLGFNLTDDEPITLKQMLLKEDNFAKMNPRFRPIQEPEIQVSMENSLSSVVMTKFMESAMIDRSNNSPYTMEDILLNHWLDLAVRGNYRAFVGVTSPRTGERIPLSVKDAYVFVWYAFCRSIGIEIDTIPQVLAKRVQRPVLPSVDELMGLVDKNYVTRDLARSALNVQPTIGDIISTEAFYNTCAEIFNAAQFQRRLIASQEHMKRRGQVLNLVSRIYTDNLCTLAQPGEDLYKQWFADRNIEIGAYTQEELGVMYVELVREATGMNLTTKRSLKDLQAVMVRMLSQLSSYSIQINADINSSDLRMTDWGAIRVGDVDGRFKDEAFFEGVAEVLGVQDKYRDFGHLDNTEIILGNDPKVTMQDSFNYEINVKVRPGKYDNIQHMRFNAAPIRVKQLPKPIPNDLGISPVLGVEQYIALPLMMRMDFDDRYGNKYRAIVPDGASPMELPPLSELITVTILNGLTYRYDGPIQQTELSKALRNTWLDGFDKT